MASDGKTMLDSFVTTLMAKLSGVDFKIKIDNFEWCVHKSVFTAKSEFFKRMLSSEFKEASDESVVLHDDNPELVARMIIWFYCDDYGEGNSTLATRASPSVTIMMTAGYAGSERYDGLKGDYLTTTTTTPLHLGMMTLADKYEIPGLVELSKRKVVANLRSSTSSFWLVLEFAHTCPDHVQEKLHELLVSQAIQNPRYYLTDDQFEDVIKKNPELTWRIVKGSYGR